VGKSDLVTNILLLPVWGIELRSSSPVSEPLATQPDGSGSIIINIYNIIINRYLGRPTHSLIYYRN